MSRHDELYHCINRRTLDRMTKKMQLISRLAMAVLRAEPGFSMDRPTLIKAIVAQGFTATDARNCLAALESREFITQQVDQRPSVTIALVYWEVTQ